MKSEQVWRTKAFCGVSMSIALNWSVFYLVVAKNLPELIHVLSPRFRYEFSEADAACALQAIDSWVDGAAHGAQHISPEKVGSSLPYVPQPRWAAAVL